MAAITEYVSGTETVGTTEWSLATDTSYDTGDAQTSDGMYQVLIDFNALAVGDQYQIRIYEKVLSSSTQRIVDEWIVNGPLSAPIWVSPALILLHGWDITLDKIAGTDRSIDWSIRKIG
jgi:hypothetical protein